jgi:DNA-directed RNA polymerase subunit E'/Rpb7
MSTELFVPIKFNTSVQLKPNEFGKNIDEIINKKLKASLENMCSKHGFIKNNSIKIIKRSIGQLVVPHFNGNIIFHMQCVGEICNPAQGSIIKCNVKAKNAMGLMAEGYYDNTPILEIIIPKLSAGIQSEIDIDKVNIGDNIKIEVCGKKFLLYDKHIALIGKAIKDKEENIQNVIDADYDDDKNTEDNDNMTNDIVDFDDEKSDVYGGTLDDEEDVDDVDDEEEEDEEEEDEEVDDDIQDDISIEEEVEDDIDDFDVD